LKKNDSGGGVPIQKKWKKHRVGVNHLKKGIIQLDPVKKKKKKKEEKKKGKR